MMLAEHPDAAQKLREEIFDKVGPFQAPTLEKMRDLTYTRAFINEALRMYPPVYVIFSTCRAPLPNR